MSLLLIVSFVLCCYCVLGIFVVFVCLLYTYICFVLFLVYVDLSLYVMIFVL